MKNVSKKIITTMIIVMITVAGLTVKSNAATINGSLTSEDKDKKLVAGSTVTVNINVTQPVYGISATLSYDTDVFESATVSSSVATSADLSNNVIVIESGTAMSAGTIGTITLKVKDSLTKTKGTVSLSNGKATDESVTTQSLSISPISIGEGSSEESEAGTPANTPAPETNTPANTPKKITSSKTNSRKLPAAGDSATIVITAAVAVIAIVGIVGFVKYAKNKDIK